MNVHWVIRLQFNGLKKVRDQTDVPADTIFSPFIPSPGLPATHCHSNQQCHKQQQKQQKSSVKSQLRLIVCHDSSLKLDINGRGARQSCEKDLYCLLTAGWKTCRTKKKTNQAVGKALTQQRQDLNDNTTKKTQGAFSETGGSTRRKIDQTNVFIKWDEKIFPEIPFWLHPTATVSGNKKIY